MVDHLGGEHWVLEVHQRKDVCKLPAAWKEEILSRRAKYATVAEKSQCPLNMIIV